MLAPQQKTGMKARKNLSLKFTSLQLPPFHFTHLHSHISQEFCGCYPHTNTFQLFCHLLKPTSTPATVPKLLLLKSLMLFPFLDPIIGKDNSRYFKLAVGCHGSVSCLIPGCRLLVAPIWIIPWDVLFA